MGNGGLPVSFYVLLHPNGSIEGAMERHPSTAEVAFSQCPHRASQREYAGPLLSPTTATVEHGLDWVRLSL